MKILVRIIFRTALFPCVCLLGIGNVSFSQGEANWWYFGQNAGLHFINGGAPIAVTDGQLNSYEGCATASDGAGNLLFYTDGITVWNRNHAQMPNGSGLMGDPSATQSGLIVQKPGSSTFYYIFTLADLAGAAGLRYTTVDMTLNGGLGDVTTNKNILLHTPSCEKITGVRHCNNKDVWVVTHDWGSSTFRTYLVTSAGVNATSPVLSNIGLSASGVNTSTIGQLKTSPDGKKLASATSNPINLFELFDFNSSTGAVSNVLLFPQYAASSGVYGLEFSPDGTKMYITLKGTGKIYQFNLCAGSNTDIANSGVLIGTSSTDDLGALQLGPDKKIYMARGSESWLGVINNPNTLGTGCNFMDNGVSLDGKSSIYGLPNFVPYYFKQTPPFSVSTTCLTGTFATPTITLTNCAGSGNAITSLSWSFGDPASAADNISLLTNPTHTFTTAGTYTVSLVLNYACGNDTLRQKVIVSCGFTVTTIPTQVYCNSQCNGSGTAMPTGGTGPYIYSWNTVPPQTTKTATGLCAGIYSVTVTDATATTATATVLITQPEVLSATVLSTGANCGNPDGAATVTPSGGAPGYMFHWNLTPAQTTQTATGLAAGDYAVTVSDANGCTQNYSVAVTSTGGLISTLSFTPSTCLANNGTATVTPTSGTYPYTYAWSPSGGTNAVATGLGAGNYTVAVTDKNGCAGNYSVMVTATSGFSSTISSTSPTCLVNNGTATVTTTGGTYPYTYVWSPSGGTNAIATGLGAGDYSVWVTDINGCFSTQTVSIAQPGALVIITNSTASNCLAADGTASATVSGGTSGYSYNWNNGQTSANVTGLSMGNYTVTVTDANGCTNTQTVTVKSVSTLTLNTSSTQTGCILNNGTATAIPKNGVAPYQYSWSNGQTTITATGLAAGTYTATITDANGCVNTKTVTVTQTTGPTAHAAANISSILLGANTTLTANGGGAYEWFPPVNLSCATCANAIATPSQTTAYCVRVTDANGCMDSACITIQVELPCGTLFIPTAFSPNNDGENEMECLMGNNCIEKLLFIIYDRWGEEVFETFDPKTCWDGTYKGKPMNSAVFVYYLKATFTNGKEISKKGNINLIR